MRIIGLCACLSVLLLACGSEETSNANQVAMGGGNNGTGGATGSNGTGGDGGQATATPGGGSLPTDVAACERGCLNARQCSDLDRCYSDISGTIITLCTQSCMAGDRGAFAALDGGR